LLAKGKGVLEFQDANRRKRLRERGARWRHRVHPADASISVTHIGSDAISVAFLFSAPGFEDFMRAVSVRDAEKNVQLSKVEEDDG
jgi:hypothetical protein